MTPLPLADFDYEYPESAVAATPAEPRDAARLLVLERGGTGVQHALFGELPRWLRPGDCVVLNRTKVLPCRLLGRKPGGGKADLLLVRELERGRWSALGSGFRAGQRLDFAAGLRALVEGRNGDGEHILSFSIRDVRAYLAEHGLAPLPPYIAKRRSVEAADPAIGLGSAASTRPKEAADRARYQTVYARDEGSIAAPTAGLHFTPELLLRLRQAGVRLAYVTLHVGRGTFQPIAGPDACGHRMRPERFELEPSEARVISDARARGGRLVSVGTSTTRALETLAGRPQGLGPAAGLSSLYIVPGHRFRAVDALITNFHLPRSTPLLLACAFAGRERLLGAYREAIGAGYRLYSYGDATLLL